MEDYRVDIGGWISRGWQQYRANWQTVTIAVAVYIVASLLISLPAIALSIPLNIYLAKTLGHIAGQAVGQLVLTLALWILLVPAAAWIIGLILPAGLAAARGRTIPLGELISQAGRRFIPLLQFMLLTCLVSGIPTVLNAGAGLVIQNGVDGKGQVTAYLTWTIINALLSIGMSFITMFFVFTSFLIVDQNMPLVASLKASARVYSRHWFMNALFMVLVSIIGFVGVFACCIGLFASAPLTLVIICVMYDELFPATQSLPT